LSGTPFLSTRAGKEFDESLEEKMWLDGAGRIYKTENLSNNPGTTKLTSV